VSFPTEMDHTVLAQGNKKLGDAEFASRTQFSCSFTVTDQCYERHKCLKLIIILLEHHTLTSSSTLTLLSYCFFSFTLLFTPLKGIIV